MLKVCCVLFTLLMQHLQAAPSFWMCGVTGNGGCTLVQMGTGFAYDPVKKQVNLLAVQPKIAVDTFSINCSAASSPGCPGGVPQVTFQTSKPVTSFILALRAIAQSEGTNNDYTKTINADGTWTITFAIPLDTGNVVLIYQTQ